ncbi:MAG: MarR family transcriptional regulator [Chloroflexota bacterium]
MSDNNQLTNQELDRFRSQNIGRYFLRVSQLYADIALQKLQSYNHPTIGMTDLTIIRHIDSNGTRSTVIAERAGITKQAVGQAIADLETNGYITKVSDPSDKRAQLVQFTDKGLGFLNDAYQIKLEIEAELASVIGEEAFTQIIESMRLLLEHYQAE